ncbi:MAG: hypothetical protein USCAAHI_01632 [Beijerinckiaceae bacterium]|nr:MAG: hypothetical protein USCAAHI_01632 [Beijerinckiaceae bacterium]
MDASLAKTHPWSGERPPRRNPASGRGVGCGLRCYANVFEDPPGTDEDFGASSPTLLPDRRMVGGGKDGNFYLFDPTEDLSLRQIFLASYDARSIRATHHIHGSPVVFEACDGVFVYVWGENDYLRCFRYDPVFGVFPGQPNERNMPGLPTAIGSVQASADDKQRIGMPGSFLSISSNGDRPGTGIVWASFPPYGTSDGGVEIGDSAIKLLFCQCSIFPAATASRRLAQIIL